MDNTATIAQEEIFGPVISVIPFDDGGAGDEQSNDTPYGLAAAVWDVGREEGDQHRSRVACGDRVDQRHPAGSDRSYPWGGYKQSGIGRELGKEGVSDYMEEKHIYFNLAEDA